MKLKRDTKFGEESSCCFKIGIRNWQNLSRALESLKNFDFNGLLLSKVYFVWAKKVQRNNLSWNWSGIQNLERNWLVVSKLVWVKKVQRSCLSSNWRGYKIWRRINLSFKNLDMEFVKFWPKHSKVSKIFTLMGSWWAKYKLFVLKKYRGIIFHET